MRPVKQSTELLLRRRFSAERLACYERATPDLKGAIELYRWNIELSGAVYEAIHIFEVVLRNAMDTELRVWNSGQKKSVAGRHSGDWLLDPSALLKRILENDLEKARERAGRSTQGSNPSVVRHSDVLAQLTLGTWRFLLPSKTDHGKNRLWDDALGKAFPLLKRPVPQLVAAVHGVYKLRNRVAHLEPLIDINVMAQLVNMRTVIGSIDDRVLSWFSSLQKIESALSKRPF